MIILRVVLLCLCLLLTACNEGEAPLNRWELSSGGLYDAALSHDGRHAVISSFTEGVSYWNRQQQQKLYVWHHGDSANSAIAHVAFSPDDKFVITADQRAFVIWDCNTGESLGYWGVDADIMDVALSRQGRYILLGLKDGRAIHIDRITERRLEVIAHHEERVTTVALSADGNIAVTGGNDHRVVVWHMTDARVIHSVERDARVKLVALNRSANRLFINSEDNHSSVYDLRRKRLISDLHFKPRQGLVSSARFTRNGKQLLLGFPGRSVSLWNIQTGEMLQEWSAPNRKVGLSPQGATVFSVSFNKENKSILAQASNGLGGEWAINTY